MTISKRTERHALWIRRTRPYALNDAALKHHKQLRALALLTSTPACCDAGHGRGRRLTLQAQGERDFRCGRRTGSRGFRLQYRCVAAPHTRVLGDHHAGRGALANIDSKIVPSPGLLLTTIGRVENWRGSPSGRRLGCIRGFPLSARLAGSVAPFPSSRQLARSVRISRTYYGQ